MKIVIVGSEGLLGKAMVNRFDNFRNKVVKIDRDNIELSDKNLIEEIHKITGDEFDIMINAAGMVNMEDCDEFQMQSIDVNGIAPGVLAGFCWSKGARFIHFSTDYVFDGNFHCPYTEDDKINPISHHGLTKAMGERQVLRAHPQAVIVRTSRLFGPGKETLVDTMLKKIMTGEHPEVVDNKYATPTYTVDLAHWLPLLFDECGIFHLTNSFLNPLVSYKAYISNAAFHLGYKNCVESCLMKDMKSWTAKRPIQSTLSIDKFRKFTGLIPRPWTQALRDYLETKYGRRV